MSLYFEFLMVYIIIVYFEYVGQLMYILMLSRTLKSKNILLHLDNTIIVI